MLAKKKSLSLHYNGLNSYLLVNRFETYQFKAKDVKITEAQLCLANVSKDFSVDNMKRIGLYGCVYDFSFDCDSIDVHDILDIHKYLTVKNNIK